MSLIMTTLGEVEEDTLAKSFVVTDNAHEYTVATEWRRDGVIVKRSVHVTLKEPALEVISAVQPLR